MKTLHDHQAAVLEAHARYAMALRAKDAVEAHRMDIDRELQSAEAELRALARRTK